MEKIETLHPEPGKTGVNISRAKYDLMRKTILAIIRDRTELTFRELVEEAERRLAGRFEGSIPWYVVTVKLDLEARSEIERIAGSAPQRLRLR
jgi:hypothetical protein